MQTVDSHEGAVRMKVPLTVKAYIPSLNRTITKNIQIIPRFIDGYFMVPSPTGGTKKEEFHDRQIGGLYIYQNEFPVGKTIDMYITSPEGGIFTWTTIQTNRAYACKNLKIGNFHHRK